MRCTSGMSLDPLSWIDAHLLKKIKHLYSNWCEPKIAIKSVVSNACFQAFLLNNWLYQWIQIMRNAWEQVMFYLVVQPTR